jgi:hypothetical protein
MPEVDFTLDPATGELTLHVTGVSGPACDDVAKLAKEMLGEPGRERATAEYHQRTQVRPHVRPKSGR